MNRTPLVELPPALAPPGAGARKRVNAAEGLARYVLGVDGGATKTLAAVLDLESKTVHLGHAGPSNEDAVGMRSAVDALLQAAEAAIARAGIPWQRLDAAVLALAGTNADAVAQHLRSERSDEWIVVNDVVAAWAAATGARPGIGVISGTGSNVLGIGVDGRVWRAGGWGHLLGDEGSGYWLASQSIGAALRDRDGTGPETALSEAVVEFFGVQSVEEVAARVYSQPLSKSEVAAFASETAKLATNGDLVARELYERGARELGRQIAAVIRGTGLAGCFPVGLIGSAFKAGAVFVAPLALAVHALAPEARMSIVEMPAVGGSLLLALRACDCEEALDATDIARLIDAALPAQSGVPG